MGLIKKIRFYKKILTTILLVNFVTLIFSFITFFDFFYSKKLLTQEIENQLMLLEQLEKLDKNLIFLTRINLKSDGEDQAYLKRKNLDEYNENLSTLKVHYYWASKEESYQEVLDKSFLEKKQIRSKIGEAKNDLSHIYLQAIFVGISILIFGFILPLVISKLLLSLIHKARRELQGQLAKLIHQWVETQKNMGPQPFQNPKFWIQIVLLITEILSPYSSHPLAQFGSEFAFILRNEMKLNKMSEDDKAASEST